MQDLVALIAALASPDAALQQSAAEQIACMEHEASPAAVALVRELETEDDSLRDWLVAALEGLGPPPVEAVPELAEIVAQAPLDSAFWAATLLGRLQAAGSGGVAGLTTALAGHPDLAVRERAAWALGQMGSAASPAQPALQQAAQSTDKRLARLAQEALQQF